jgi:hypothetical protein
MQTSLYVPLTCGVKLYVPPLPHVVRREPAWAVGNRDAVGPCVAEAPGHGLADLCGDLAGPEEVVADLERVAVEGREDAAGLRELRHLQVVVRRMVEPLRPIEIDEIVGHPFARPDAVVTHDSEHPEAHGCDVQVVVVVDRDAAQDLALVDGNASCGGERAIADRAWLVQDRADRVVDVVGQAVVGARLEDPLPAGAVLEHVVPRAAVLVGGAQHDAPVEPRRHGPLRLVHEVRSGRAAAGHVVGEAGRQVAAVAQDHGQHRFALLRRIADARTDVEVFGPLVVIHHHGGQAPGRRRAVRHPVVDPVPPPLERRYFHPEAPQRVLLAAPADEAGALRATTGPIVDMTPSEVEEVMDHHSAHRERLGVRILAVDERHLFPPGDVAGLGRSLAAVGPQREPMRVVHVGSEWIFGE